MSVEAFGFGGAIDSASRLLTALDEPPAGLDWSMRRQLVGADRETGKALDAIDCYAWRGRIAVWSLINADDSITAWTTPAAISSNANPSYPITSS